MFSTKEIVEKNKPPSLFAVSLGKKLCGMPPSLCGEPKKSICRGGPVQLNNSKKGYGEAHILRSFSKNESSCPFEEENLKNNEVHKKNKATTIKIGKIAFFSPPNR